MGTKTKFFLISFYLVSFCCLSQNTFIPDDSFEQVLIDLGLDSGPLDDFVPTSNITPLTSLDLSFDTTGLIISDLTGIEDFTSLNQLFIQNNQLTSVDVSSNTNLQILWCFNNQLSNLNVSQNPKLISLRCEDNLLTSLDTLNNINLNVLICERNNLSTLNVSNNTGLSRLQYGSNNLTNLDVRNNTNLSYLSCQQNNITTLNVENNSKLTTLLCFENIISALNLSNNFNLTEIDCSNNTLCSLNLNNGNNTNITSINFEFNPDLNCVVVDNPDTDHTTWQPSNFANYVNSNEACSDFIPVDNLDTVFVTSYTLPTLNNGNYFTGPNGMGTALNAGSIINGTQTIFIYNQTSCYSNQTSFSVIINNEDYFIPKYFTPNNDGINDVWQVYDRLNLVNNISIYNRYGKLLKFLPNTTIGWDGTYNGQILNSDSYWYEIILNSKEVLRGYFTLKR
ncbi:T9SS type B sorting domain-containing protein [Algibacter sp. AS12]|uniref:T9SS type B sorting domain-containing protein n=1 Tax=Algibacter sp. AS12 TaxID=3135773 RepID=UPI00398B210E